MSTILYIKKHDEIGIVDDRAFERRFIRLDEFQIRLGQSHFEYRTNLQIWAIHGHPWREDDFIFTFHAKFQNDSFTVAGIFVARRRIGERHARQST